MNRGDLYIVAGGSGYAGKPRPALIVQDDAFGQTGSVTICLLTSDPTEAPDLRIRLEPGKANGLSRPSHIMVDKIMTVARARLGERIGSISKTDMARVERAIMVFLGLAG